MSDVDKIGNEIEERGKEIDRLSKFVDIDSDSMVANIEARGKEIDSPEANAEIEKRGKDIDAISDTADEATERQGEYTMVETSI